METGGEAAEVATAEAAAAEAMAEKTVAAEKEAAAGAGEVEDAAVEKGAAEEEESHRCIFSKVKCQRIGMRSRICDAPSMISKGSGSRSIS